MYPERYIYDPLYGQLSYPDFIWQVLSCPELQRLREVRLCNINSLCLTGGANVNRYEHAMGTAFLALQCLSAWPSQIEDHVARRIALAALLHDVGSTAFGHSVQYVLSSEGFEHESFKSIVNPAGKSSEKYGYRLAFVEPVHFGIPGRLGSLLSSADIEVIDDMVLGRGPYGPLINGTIDLDNMDNVYRLAYHYGFVRNGDVPLSLARSVWAENGKLVVHEDALPLLDEWHKVRETLYRYLLLNPEEFAAKCMLEEALHIAVKHQESHFLRWHDVDFEVLTKLAGCSHETAMIVRRLMIGDLYGCVGIYSTPAVAIYDRIGNVEERSQGEKDIQEHIRRLRGGGLGNAVIGLHTIKDVNKTRRQIEVVTHTGRRAVIGEASSRLLIGVFFKNVHLSMMEIKPDLLVQLQVRQIVKDRLERLFDIPALEELKLYGESKRE